MRAENLYAAADIEVLVDAAPGGSGVFGIRRLNLELVAGNEMSLRNLFQMR